MFKPSDYKLYLWEYIWHMDKDLFTYVLNTAKVKN